MEVNDNVHEICVDKTSCKHERSLKDKSAMAQSPNNPVTELGNNDQVKDNLK